MQAAVYTVYCFYQFEVECRLNGWLWTWSPVWYLSPDERENEHKHQCKGQLHSETGLCYLQKRTKSENIRSVCQDMSRVTGEQQDNALKPKYERSLVLVPIILSDLFCYFTIKYITRYVFLPPWPSGSDTCSLPQTNPGI